MAAKLFFQAWRQNLGRNGWDQPTAIPDDMSAESMNIELRDGGLGKKRTGTESIAITTLNTGGTYEISKFVPGNDPTLAELWFFGDAKFPVLVSQLWRVPTTAASAVGVKGGLVRPLSFAALNGKYFIASDTAANRINVYAPNESTTTVRLAGLKPEAPPTIADQGVGTYPAVPRTYRTIGKRIVAGVVVSQSEPSTDVAFTPSGAGASARVTKGAATGEGETHWAVEAAAADGVFWIISGDIAVGTATYDDTVEPRDYDANGDVPPLIGSNYPFPSVKYLFSDGTRLLGLGAWETATGDSVPPVSGRLYFTPAFGTSDMGDDERIVNTTLSSGWIDLAIGAGGIDRGIGGLINNAVIAFQSNGVYAFVPTGNPDAPYRRDVLSTQIGNISGKAIVLAEDEGGQPALYWLDPVNGCYRIGTGFIIQRCGKDVQDLWNTAGTGATASNFEAEFWGVYDSARKLIIWTCRKADGTSFQMVFDVTNGRTVSANEVRYGWVQWTEPKIIGSTGGVMFSNGLTAAPHSLTNTLYYGRTSISNIVFRVVPTLTQDDGQSYQGYVRSRAYWWSPMGRLKKLLEAVVVAKARAATTIRALFIPNWGEQSGVTHNISIAPSGSSTYVRVRPDPVNTTDLAVLQFELGDAAPANTAWELEGIEAQIEILENER